MEYKEWFSNEKNKKLIPALKGKTVVEVEHYSDYPSFLEGWVLTFDDGTRLTARDSEYGDDAFKILDEESFNEIRREAEEAKIRILSL